MNFFIDTSLKVLLNSTEIGRTRCQLNSDRSKWQTWCHYIAHFVSYA